jgi:hypothetical protein
LATDFREILSSLLLKYRGSLISLRIYGELGIQFLLETTRRNQQHLNNGHTGDEDKERMDVNVVLLEISLKATVLEHFSLVSGFSRPEKETLTDS